MPQRQQVKQKEAVGESAIDCKGLTRRFGDFTAVDHLELHVRKGELFGFLGPNGAGKTTTLRMLTTLIPATEGAAAVAGFDIHADGNSVRDRIGIVPQQFSLFEELTPVQNLWYIGKLYGMDEDAITAKTKELLERVSLWDKKDVVCEGFSGGMKQRLSVAAGLLHKPEILFMDEPTTGLDPQSRISLRELTRELNRNGITIIYTTHDMFEADKLCNRIAIMDHGKIIALGTPEELKEKYGKGYRIELELEQPAKEIEAELTKMLDANNVEVENHDISLHVKTFNEKVINKITSFLKHKRIPLKTLNMSEPTLEEVFINLTKKDLRD